MKKILALSLLATSAVACSVAAESIGEEQLGAVADMKGAKKRADGKYDVTCDDGTTEVRTAGEILADQVCLASPDAGFDAGPQVGDSLDVPVAVGTTANIDVITSANQTGVIPGDNGYCGTNFYTQTGPYALVKLTNPTPHRAIVSLWTAPSQGGASLNTSMAIYKAPPTTKDEVQACIGVASAKCESAPCDLDRYYKATGTMYTAWAGFVSGDNHPVDLAPGESVIVRIASLNGTGFFSLKARTDALLPALANLDGALSVAYSVGTVAEIDLAASAAKLGVVPGDNGYCGTNFYTQTSPYALVKLSNPTAKRAIVSLWTSAADGGSALNTSLALYATPPSTKDEVQACLGVASAKCESAPCDLDRYYKATGTMYTAWAGLVSGDNHPVDLAPGQSIFVRIGALNGTGYFSLKARTDLLK